MTLTIKPEYVGEVIEIIRNSMNIVLDTNLVLPEDYTHYYDNGFDWVFDVS